MKVKLIFKLMKARKYAEKSLGVKFDKRFAIEVLELCKRKLQLTDKDDSYLPMLYESELVMKHHGRLITASSAIRKEEISYVCRVQTASVSPEMP